MPCDIDASDALQSTLSACYYDYTEEWFLLPFMYRQYSAERVHCAKLYAVRFMALITSVLYINFR